MEGHNIIISKAVGEGGICALFYTNMRAETF